MLITQPANNGRPVMLKLIVFDCDGVMFDSRQANIMYYNSLLNNYNLPSMAAAEEEFVHMHSVVDSVQHIFRHYHSPTLDTVHAHRLQGDYSAFMPYMVMEAELRPFLEQVKDRYHLAISTNRTNTMIPLLQRFQLDGYFSKVMTADKVAKPKPAPDALLEILDFYNCHPEEAIFIGDSVVDEQHAAAAGVPLIAFKNQALNATYHVQGFLEILSLPPFAKYMP
jgi:HAD superfamily hydrolase (TIGR01509 family)